ncbi:hypothetical protein [Pontibacter ummariensis]|uniref:hypothetical protein n=1 Tax=Pontibacter ummariensis TaxID=1610492 RepID=UPI000D084EC0|nr:hypothetical protein [Pontibacter ummariensis]
MRSKESSKNWELEEQLLERTIKSLLNQENQTFKIILVYADKPNLSISSDKLLMFEFPYPFLEYKDINYDLPVSKEKLDIKWVVGEMDKGRKIMYGCKEAKKLGCNYIMQVDSDDLVHRNLSSFVDSNGNANKPGWFIDKGYIYIEGKNYLIKQASKMNLINGSTHIIRDRLIIIPDFLSTKASDFFLFCNHGYLRNKIFHDNNEELEPLPFYGNIYIASGNNQSNIYELSQANNLKNFFKLILRSKIITKSLKKTFGLNKIKLYFF